MHRFNNNLALQGMLALLAFALLLVVAAKALQPQHLPAPDPVMAAALQEAQQPAASRGTQSDTQSPDPRQDGKSVPGGVFHGTIVRDGSDFVFRDQSGIVYRLDAPEKAKPFVGKTVKLSGQVEKDARLIHVQHVEKTAA